jgi:hypothetical protein
MGGAPDGCVAGWAAEAGAAGAESLLHDPTLKTVKSPTTAEASRIEWFSFIGRLS